MRHPVCCACANLCLCACSTLSFSCGSFAAAAAAAAAAAFPCPLFACLLRLLASQVCFPVCLGFLPLHHCMLHSALNTFRCLSLPFAAFIYCFFHFFPFISSRASTRWARCALENGQDNAEAKLSHHCASPPRELCATQGQRSEHTTTAAVKKNDSASKTRSCLLFCTHYTSLNRHHSVLDSTHIHTRARVRWHTLTDHPTGGGLGRQSAGCTCRSPARPRRARAATAKWV